MDILDLIDGTLDYDVTCCREDSMRWTPTSWPTRASLVRLLMWRAKQHRGRKYWVHSRGLAGYELLPWPFTSRTELPVAPPRTPTEDFTVMVASGVRTRLPHGVSMTIEGSPGNYEVIGRNTDRGFVVEWRSYQNSGGSPPFDHPSRIGDLAPAPLR